MTVHPSWTPLETDAESAARQLADPLMALSCGDLPAIVLRGAHPAADCAALMSRFQERGYFDPAMVGVETQLSGGSYLDLGTSLGRMGADRSAFFAHAQRTHDLFPQLFADLADPVETIYRNLRHLSGGRAVHTATSDDGHAYGPAIFRIYKGQEGHHPHFDSIRRRGRGRAEYEVSRYTHQFAGVMCMQKGSVGGEAILYQAKAEGEVEDLVDENGFEEYAERNQIARTQVELNPGDLYFFYTENVHEVPKVVRDSTRVVLAVFAATSQDSDHVVVWS